MLRTTTVASGEYTVRQKKLELLEAHLGTCVGVSLVDRKNEVGGLAHFLLAEPIGSDPGWKPACYASTGMPLFLKSLLDAGAQRSDLEAVVGGGALLGPLSQLDLSLDIGGRTAEWVSGFLEHEQIPIRQQETGGMYTCRMRLNLASFESTIDQMDQDNKGVGSAVTPLSLEILDSQIEKLKPIPQVVLKLIRHLSKESLPIKDIARDLGQDQVLAGRILKICNSAAMGLMMEIDSIAHAAALLGGMHLWRLAVASSMELVCEQVEKGYSLCKGGMYQHAVGTAEMSRRLALFTGAALPDLAYTAGLMHDIGKIVLDQHVARNQPFFYRATQIEANDLCTIEKLIFGYAHTEIGERLARNWRLPSNLMAVIRHHHQPEEAAEHQKLVTLVYLADLLMARFQVGLELDRLSTERLVERLRCLGLSLDQLPRLTEVAFQSTTKD
jgi:putative nucleotidyltransferase with HDIG domain